MSNVYFTKTITSESVEKLFKKIQLEQIVHEKDLCAIKTHFGEKGNKGYIKPELIKPIIKKIKSLKANPFLTDSNTIYVGQRANAVNHMMTAYEHKFTPENMECPVIIADGLLGNSYTKVEISQKHIKKAEIGSAIHFANSMICVTHVKGHMAFSLAGAIKNIGMGCASRTGKFKLHSNVKPLLTINNCTSCGICVNNCPGNALSLKDKKTKIEYNANKCIGCGECIAACSYHVFRLSWSEKTASLVEKTVEYCSAVMKNKRILFISFLNFVTKNCDCGATNEQPVLDNIGILASTDIVSIDQASAEILTQNFGSDFFKNLWPELDWQYQLDYAQKIGLGSRKYDLLEI